MSSADEYLICPCNKNHVILKSRWNYHVTSCVEKHPHLNLKKCPYDNKHYIPGHEFEEHVKTCSSRPARRPPHQAVQTYQNTLGIVPIRPSGVEEAHNSKNSDEEPEVESYNPQANIEDKPVVRVYMGGSKSEKKEFKELERRRLIKLSNEEEKQKKLEKERRKLSRDNQMMNATNTSQKGPIQDLSDEQHETNTMNRSLINYSESAVIQKETQGNMVSASKEYFENAKPKFVINKSQGALPKRRNNTTTKSSWAITPTIQNNEAPATEKCDKSSNSVNETPKNASTESYGAISKRRNNTTTKSCWAITPMIQNNEAPAIEKCDELSNSVNETSKNVSTKSYGAIPKRRNNATSKSCWTITDAVTQKSCWNETSSSSFADIIKKNRQKSFSKSNPDLTVNAIDNQEKDSTWSFGPNRVSVSTITKKCNDILLSDYITDVTRGNDKNNNDKNSKKCFKKNSQVQ